MCLCTFLIFFPEIACCNALVQGLCLIVNASLAEWLYIMDNRVGIKALFKRKQLLDNDLDQLLNDFLGLRWIYDKKADMNGVMLDVNFRFKMKNGIADLYTI